MLWVKNAAENQEAAMKEDRMGSRPEWPPDVVVRAVRVTSQVDNDAKSHRFVHETA